MDTINQHDVHLKRATFRLGIWTMLWVVSLAIATFGQILVWQDSALINLLAIGANLAFGIGAIIANKQHLLSLDEMFQRITLHAMAVTLGTIIVLGMSIELLNSAGLLGFEPKISHLYFVMGPTLIISTFWFKRQYT